MTEMQLSKLHKQIAVKDDIKTAVIYSVRNWLAHRLQLPGDNVYLERAYQGAMAAHRRNEPNVRLLSLAIFMAIESGHHDIAGNMLDKAMEYRSFLKANEPFYYGVFCFLRAYLSIIGQRARAAKKHRKAFTAYIAGVGASPYYDVMQGQLHLAAAEYATAYGHLKQAYNGGCRSVYLHENLYRCYQHMGMQAEGAELLHVLAYAAARGADISRVAAAHEDALFKLVMRDPLAGERLYALSGYAPLLKPICTVRMQNEDYGPEAHKLYRAAAEKQVVVSGLAAFLVESSYVNNVDDVSRYFMERFLKNAEMEHQLAVYVYYLLLTDPAHAGLIQGHEDMIMETAARCLESEGSAPEREVNALYQFYWARCKAMGITGKLVERAEAALSAGITQFELVPGKGTQYVYVLQPEKRGLEEYEFTGGSLIIDAIHENFSYTCFGAGRRSITDSNLSGSGDAPLGIRRVVPLADPELYQYFFDKGDRRFHVLAHLACYYLQGDETAEPHSVGVPIQNNFRYNMYNMNPEKAIPLFETVLAEKSISTPFRMKILTSLGHLYHQAGSHSKALECYAEIDMTTLDAADIQKIMDIYLQSREYNLAAKLIAQYHKTIPAAALYEGLGLLLTQYDGAAADEDTPCLAEAAYNLLLAGYSNEALHNFVLTHHKASQSEWKTLARAISSADPRLDIKILSGDLWMSKCDGFTQKAFRRLYAVNKAPAECRQFVEFCKFAILAQDLLPEYETIHILEKIFLGGDNDTFLLLALCHTYLHHNITTLRSDKILQQCISAQQNLGILLPIFKEGKLPPHPYLEKYQPFLYRDTPGRMGEQLPAFSEATSPGKDIRLNYRIGEADFKQMPMQYLRYGLYTAKLPVFYNETVTYYYSEEMPTGSIATHESSHKNTAPYIHNNHADAYFTINNAVIYEQMFRHEQVEKIIDSLVKEPVEVRGRLL